MNPGALARVELPCHDPPRLHDFYGRILGLPPAGPYGFLLGAVELVLRARGDALFPLSAPSGGGGVLLALPVPEEELDRWHRRMMTTRVAVLEAPGPGGTPPRRLRVADPEGNVLELFAAP
ncbi:VOC family protein [Crenalkalicoccus roseus]|uniref:VOC family protein n=1 Tax=Crenalkalicoccus roseus TaxID=1485588 RepID=UPI001080C606|nr:VOC family protein [Crenalkalicoccus roseus]